MNDWLVEFWRCKCGKPYRSQRATFQRLAAFLPIQSTDSASVNLLCGACNSIRSYNKMALGSPDMVDSSKPAQYVYVEKIFLAQIACVEKTCEYRIQVLVPSSVHWTKDTLTRRSCNWKVDAAAVCRSFHPAVDPIQLVNLQRVYPGKDPMENNMTKKEMALTLLDRIERLESDRASLIAHLELIRYADQRQPDVNKIMSDHRVLDTVRARNVELRRSIALASDDTAAQTLLAGLLED